MLLPVRLFNVAQTALFASQAPHSRPLHLVELVLLVSEPHPELCHHDEDIPGASQTPEGVNLLAIELDIGLGEDEDGAEEGPDPLVRFETGRMAPDSRPLSLLQGRAWPSYGPTESRNVVGEPQRRPLGAGSPSTSPKSSWNPTPHPPGRTLVALPGLCWASTRAILALRGLGEPQEAFLVPKIPQQVLDLGDIERPRLPYSFDSGPKALRTPICVAKSPDNTVITLSLAYVAQRQGSSPSALFAQICPYGRLISPSKSIDVAF